MPIPFISDSFNHWIHSIFCYLHMPIHIYNYGNISLHQSLSKLRKPRWTCNKWNCLVADDKLPFLYNMVYSIQCNDCSKEYVGSTTRYLHDRIKQHLFPSTNSAITEHFKSCGSPIRLTISVISRHTNSLDTRLAESIHIFRRGPALNRRHECESSTSIIQHYTETFNTHTQTHTAWWTSFTKISVYLP